jgi:hypothetical protein
MFSVPSRINAPADLRQPLLADLLPGFRRVEVIAAS